MQLEALLELYRKHQLLQSASSHHYGSVVTSVENFMGADPALDQLTPELFLEYRRAILSRCSPVTFNNYRRHLSALFNFAVSKKLMTENPFKCVKSAPVPKRKPKTVAVGYLQEIIDFLAQSGDKLDSVTECGPLTPKWFWLIVVKTLYYTGIRRRQLTELRLDDVDFEKKLIRLRAESSKTKNEWHIPLNEALIPELLYLRGRVIKTMGKFDPEQQLFCYPLFSQRPHRFKDLRMTGEHVTNWFKRITQSMGKRISPHRIRHTAATELARKTKNIRLVQEILGHSDLRTTFIYIEPEMDEMRKLMTDMTNLSNTL